MEAFYVGCWHQVGHYTWFPGMVRAPYRDEEAAGPWGYNGLDCAHFNTRGWAILKKDGWTAVGLEDRSVDKRPNSHSVFAFHADLTLDEAVELARKTFPDVFARPGFPAPPPVVPAAGPPSHIPQEAADEGDDRQRALDRADAHMAEEGP